MARKIAVGIPTVGRAWIADTLRSLQRQTRRPDLVVVVNQGPVEAQESIRASYDGPLEIVQQDVKGLSRARNAALDRFRTIGFDWMMWIDDDEEATVEWVEQLERLADAYPELSFFGGPYYPPIKIPEGEVTDVMYAFGEPILNRDTFLNPILGTPGLHNEVWGGNGAFSRQAIDLVRDYDPYMGAGAPDMGGEDRDYAIRLITAGAKGMLSSRLAIYHTHGTRPLRERQAEAEVRTLASFAGLQLKAELDPGRVSPALVDRARPYGLKWAKLGRLTGGLAGKEHSSRGKEVDRLVAELGRKYDLVEGVFRPKPT